jgi:hypothetical protein
MRKNDCEIVRRELDELTLGESCGAAALAHLQDCSECLEFNEKQTRLRQMVGSLGTVAAPADFDFRLRARLANESSGAFHLRSASWMFARRGLAVATLVLLVATGVVVVRNIVNQPNVSEVAESNPRPAVNPEPSPETIAAPKPSEEPLQNDHVTVKDAVPQRVRPERVFQAGIRPKRNIMTKDVSSEQAGVLNGSQSISSSEVFPIDASVESFKVSLDDGHGNARTISLPTIRFGSQRMLPGSNQYAAKRVW